MTENHISNMNYLQTSQRDNKKIDLCGDCVKSLEPANLILIIA